MVRIAVVGSVLAFSIGCGGVILVAPPGREDMSTGLSIGPPSTSPANVDVHVEQRLAAGAHIASASKSGTFPVDIGTGYIFTRVGLDHPRNVHGGYFEVAPFIPITAETRAFLGARAEVLIPDADARPAGYALMGRLSYETFAPVEWSAGTSDKKTAVGSAGYGMFGIGAFAEAGLQHLPGDDRSASVILLGVLLRNPAAVAAAVATK